MSTGKLHSTGAEGVSEPQIDEPTDETSSATNEGDSTRGEDPVSELSRETVFEMLSNQRRRYVAHFLFEREEPTELRELSREVAAWENEKRPEEITTQERRRVYNALQQSHLPKLDDAGFINFDQDRGTVEAAETLDDLQVYLEIVPGDEIPWSLYYLLLGLFCGSLTLAAWVGVPPFDAVPGIALAATVALLFLCSGAVHAYYARKMRLGTAGRPPSAK